MPTKGASGTGTFLNVRSGYPCSKRTFEFCINFAQIQLYLGMTQIHVFMVLALGTELDLELGIGLG